jgi:NAD(P)-dependent dehydrogenase (short-subunit alcohol dehydrogenase family)
MIKNNQGSIINITSINSELAFPRNPSYVASKGGLKMLGKSFAKDLGIHGIRVNNIGPGYIKTNMTKNSFKNKKLKQTIEKHTMLNRWGTPEDLIGPAIFLASDSSRYVTGQDIYVDGGWLANGLVGDQ